MRYAYEASALPSRTNPTPPLAVSGSAGTEAEARVRLAEELRPRVRDSRFPALIANGATRVFTDFPEVGITARVYPVERPVRQQPGLTATSASAVSRHINLIGVAQMCQGHPTDDAEGCVVVRPYPQYLDRVSEALSAGGFAVYPRDFANSERWLVIPGRRR